MATTQLADIYDPLVFNQAVQEAAIELNRFLASGVMQTDPRIDQMASGPGQLGDLPFYFGLTNDEPNYSSDNPASTSTPAKITSGLQKYMSAHMNKSWATMDLARELALEDPLGAITNRVAKYWAVNTEKRLINSAIGVLNDNIANDSGDMVNAIHSEQGSTATDANRISAEAVLDAKQTMGDHGENLVGIAMHSIQYTQLQKQNLIDYIPNARGEVMIPTYLGYRVTVDDSMPVRAGGTDGFVYTVILFASNAFAYGSGSPTVPSEIDREPATGDGGGQDILYSRATEIVHPWGFAFDPTAGTPVAGQSPTYPELQDATKWDRVYQHRKNVGMAFLTCN